MEWTQWRPGAQGGPAVLAAAAGSPTREGNSIVVAITSSEFSGNRVLGGDGGSGGSGGKGASGGSSPSGMGGQGGVAGAGGAGGIGGQALGGAIDNGPASITLTQFNLTGNQAVGGLGGAGGIGGTGGNGGNASYHSFGGNGGKGGAGGTAGSGGEARGGGVYDDGGAVTLNHGKVSMGTALGGNGGIGGAGGAGGNRGTGGLGNGTSGVGGAGALGGNGGNGFGGGLYASNAYIRVLDTIYSEDGAIGGSAGAGGLGGPGGIGKPAGANGTAGIAGLGEGGAIYASGGTRQIKKATFANNSASTSDPDMFFV